MNFQPGDRVRFLDQEGEGVVVAIWGAEALVETSDGFEYPFPKSALVLISSTSEKSEQVFKSDEPEKVVLGKYGLFICYVPKGERLIEAHFVNKTSYDILYSLNEERGGNKLGLLSGTLDSGSYVKLFSRNMEDMDKWPLLDIRVLYHNSRSVNPPSAAFTHKVVPRLYFEHKMQAPIIGKEGHVYQLDGKEWQHERESLNDQLKNAFQGKKLNDFDDLLNTDMTLDVVDLHLEAIPNAPTDLALKSILKFQVTYAEKMLDMALRSGIGKITFIHGAGDGVLKREIQKLGREHPNVSSTGKADALKFGSGATFLSLK